MHTPYETLLHNTGICEREFFPLLFFFFCFTAEQIYTLNKWDRRQRSLPWHTFKMDQQIMHAYTRAVTTRLVQPCWYHQASILRFKSAGRPVAANALRWFSLRWATSIDVMIIMIMMNDVLKKVWKCTSVLLCFLCVDRWVVCWGGGCGGVV